MNAWDATRYQDQHSFVWRFGANLLESLNPQPDDRILDVGCGTGQLTAEIARSGAAVTGLDNSAEMITQARVNYPNITFVLGDAACFHFLDPFDAVFSNAVLHWVKDAEGAIQSIASALRPGGRFIAEFGGKGNNATVRAALREVIGPDTDSRSPWYYPSVGEYTPLLERHGFEVREARLFDRLTPLEGEDGMANWLRMFTGTYLRPLGPERSEEAVRQIVNHLRPALYRDGTWTVDYRRLQVACVRL